MKRTLATSWTILVAILALACPGSGSGPEEPDAGCPGCDGGLLGVTLQLRARLLLEPTQATILSAFPDGDAGFVLVEEETQLRVSWPQGASWAHPKRVRWIGQDGSERSRYEVDAGTDVVVDAVSHPSGTMSILETDGRGWFLTRRSRGEVLARARISLAPNVAGIYVNGPFLFGQEDVPAMTPAAGRLAARGEGLHVAVRAARNTIVAIDYSARGDGSLEELGQELIVPGLGLDGVGLRGGTFDVFGALENNFHLYLDASDPALPPFLALDADTDTLAASNIWWPWLFPIDPSPIAPGGRATDILLASLREAAQDTVRVVVGTRGVDELYGLRTFGGAVHVVGRTGPQGPDGNGWNAMIVATDRDGGALFLELLDLDRGDVLFDVAPASEGRLVAVGATGFHQNPSGASIDEATSAFAVVLDARGRLLNRIELPQLGRSNQARFVLALGEDRFLVSGMLDGPGTHSADANPARAASRGALWILEPHVP